MPTKVYQLVRKDTHPSVQSFHPSHSFVLTCCSLIFPTFPGLSKLLSSTLARFADFLHLIRRTIPGFPSLSERYSNRLYWIADEGAGIGRSPGKMSNPESKPSENKQTSYLTAGISAFSPWSSRSASPKQDQESQVAQEPALASTKGGDHTISHKHRLSLRKYPRDCPVLNVQWFHAVDVGCASPSLENDSVESVTPYMLIANTVSEAETESDWRHNL